MTPEDIKKLLQGLQTAPDIQQPTEFGGREPTTTPLTAKEKVAKLAAEDALLKAEIAKSDSVGRADRVGRTEKADGRKVRFRERPKTDLEKALFIDPNGPTEGDYEEERSTMPINVLGSY